jgi:hypothetical protein|nr:MAG TPA: hypothetical protein [Caudoviricetes sp.]
MRIKSKYNALQAPYIKADVEITQAGVTNGRDNIPQEKQYCIAPSAKKIAQFITNQLFGSELVTQSEGLDIGWLMPSLKEALELAVYQEESFIYLNIFEGKVYLECFKESDIHDIVQEYDKFRSGTIVQEYDSPNPKDDKTYLLKRNIKIVNGSSLITYKAFEKGKGEAQEIPLNRFNAMFDKEYEPREIKPYEVMINVDIGQDFFKDSRKFLYAEMDVFNTIVEEVEKTKTRIATTQHYQTGDLMMNWKPGNKTYNVQTISVGKLNDYFTLMPGDKEHAVFQFLQGNIRIREYVETFKFYDYQVIQMSGLSPASFGYEKDVYQNVDNVNMSKNPTDMTIEAIKRQITPAINLLFENIIKAQMSANITENQLPTTLNWDFGPNEKFGDMEKLKILRNIQGVASIPQSSKLKVVLPILNKLIDDDYVEGNKQEVDELLTELKGEQDDLSIRFGEV